MATWPATLPQTHQLQGHSEVERDAVIRSPMGYGPAKLRKRVTTSIVEITSSITVTTAQKATLNTFYTANATVSWTWDDGQASPARTYRFVTPPAYAPITPGLWAVTLQLEVVP